jgi:hypothetical protein
MTMIVKDPRHPPFGEGEEGYKEWSKGRDVLILRR